MALSAFVLSTAAVGWPALAQERFRRDWSSHPGMPRQIWDVTYDDRGFLWIASEEGIHRFDGQEVVPWGREVLSTAVHGLNRGPDGRIVAFVDDGAAYQVTPQGLEVVAGPDGEPFATVYDADYSGDGRLWLCGETGLFREHPSAGWMQVAPPELSGQTVIRLRGAPDGGAFLGTFQGSFVRILPDGTARTLMSDPTGQVTRIAVKDERTQAFSLRFGPNHGVFLVEDGQVSQVYRRPAPGRRWTGMAFRDDTLWVVATSEVLAIGDGGRRIEVLGPADGFYLGGEVVVDHEKSLWLVSFRGLYQFTEPDVVLFTEMDGTRKLYRVGPDLIAARWEGPYRYREDGTWEALAPEKYRTSDPGGVAPWKSIWFVGVENFSTPRRRDYLLELGPAGWVRHLTRDPFLREAAYAVDGETFWIAFDDALWRVDEEGAAPQRVATLERARAVLGGMVIWGDRLSMAFRYGPYCEAVLDASRRALQSDWVCETIEGAGELLDLKLVDGVPWIGTRDRGLLRLDGDVWRTVVDQTDLGTPTVRGISISPRGGVWVISYLRKFRVVLEEGRARVVERLGPWMGVPDWMSFEAFEEPDGTIWLSGMTAAIRIPSHARQRPAAPPRVFVTGFSADGRVLSPGTKQTLPATTRRIELSWAAPAYRDPASLRYQVRADPADDWVPTRHRSFRFVDLGPGDYRIELRASLDGESWSAAAADVRFAIRSPLWRRPTFWAATLSAVAIAVLLLQWLRTRQQVRLERQRTSIAMNLHDELGAGLASIGLLTDLAADEEMEPGEGREVATRVGEISRDLSRSLSDIVWTLRPASVDLPGFALFLRQRASDLLSAGDTAVEFHFPDPVPAVRLELEVRRQIHAIASEALHNAAKHARASRVSVGLERDGNGWVLRVTDDGVGFDEERGAAGLGLESMRKRAATIGAHLSVRATEDGGCGIELRFTPRVEGHR